ncbi:vitamin K epoxide reductase family protein, partial [Nesterenkonia sp. F]|uniref:vitamin K epoxide reductase family protein n=1 Tax=Nesterenkonia sp. F TaxID=795955 RepID=UPI000255CFDD
MTADSSVESSPAVPAGPRRFGDRGMGVWLLATGAVATLATLLLLYERVQIWQNPDHVTACDVNPWVSCGAVMGSWQAATFGFPNIFIGVVGFPLILAIAVSLLGGIRLPRWYWGGLQVGVLFAFGFCVWLWSQAVYAISALCPYCMLVWAAVIPMTVVVTARNIEHGVLPVPRGLRRVLADWWWVAMVLLYLLGRRQHHP